MEKSNAILIGLLPPPYGGIASWSKKTLEIAPNYGINYVFVNESNQTSRKHFGDNTKRNIFSDIKRAFRIRKDLKKALKSTDESYVVHCNIPSLKYSMIRELSNLKLIKKYNRKYIIHFRSTVANNVQTKKQKKLVEKLLKRADKILLLNKQSYDFCYDIFPNNKMEILPNYVDATETDPNHLINDSIKKILYVGMATLEKGVDDIIDVSTRFPSITFEIIGRVSEEIKQYCENKCLPNVSFLGQMDKKDIMSYYKKADMFLFLSRFKSEGFSNALCEAMGMGLPCIVTDWAANRDMVFSDYEEVIVKPHDIDSLEKSIKFFENKEIRTKISQSNYKKVIDEYSDRVVLKRIKSIYDSIR